jgi:hypothetical protein
LLVFLDLDILVSEPFFVLLKVICKHRNIIPALTAHFIISPDVVLDYFHCSGNGTPKRNELSFLELPVLFRGIIVLQEFQFSQAFLGILVFIPLL